MSNQPAEIPLSALLSFWGSHAGDKVLSSFFLLPSPLTQMWYGWPQCLLQRRALSDSLHCLRRCNSDGSAGWRFGVSELVVRRRSQKTRFWEAWIATATILHHVVVFVLSRRWCVTFLFFAVEGDCVLFFYCQMFRWSVFESVVKGQRYNKAKNSLGNCAKTGSQNGWLTTWCTSVVVKLGSTDSWDQHSFPLHIHLGSWYACLKNGLTSDNPALFTAFLREKFSPYISLPKKAQRSRIHPCPFSEDEPDKPPTFAIGEDCLVPRLLLSRQLGCLHLLPCSLPTQGTACKRGRLLSGWVWSRWNLGPWYKWSSLWTRAKAPWARALLRRWS